MRPSHLVPPTCPWSTLFPDDRLRPLHDAMAKSSLDQNPPNADRHLTPGGSDWLWAVFAIMLLSALGMIAYSFTVSHTLL